jgi:copper transport protein
VAAALALAPLAGAHSVLIATEPGNDDVVAESPPRVLLRYDEPVESALGSIRVFDANGDRVDAETITRPSPEEVAVAIERELSRGTYTVTWRVISADSDPINGAFVFHVEAPGAQPSGIAAQVLEGTPTIVSVFFTGGRFFDFALLLLCVGGITALALVLPSARRAVVRRLYAILAACAGALVVVALLGIVFQGAAAGGFGLREAFTWDVFSSVAETRYGEASLIRAALAATVLVAALALRRTNGRDRTALLGLCVLVAGALVVTPSASGHASTVGALAVASDAAHVFAAAAWTGGLGFVVLALVLSRSDRWPLAARAVPRFSMLAVGAVAVLLIAGTINGFLQVRTWSALWETTYGLLLLAKVGLVLPLLALGAYNNRYAVPRLREQVASRIEQRRFLRAAGAELAIMVAVVAVTAVLVNAEPARTELVMMHGSSEATVAMGNGVDCEVTADPGMAGRNEIHLMFSGHGGEAVELEEVTIAATLPDEEIGPFRYTARPVPGHHGEFVVENAQLPIPGEWQVRIEARRGEFELLTANASISIREES